MGTAVGLKTHSRRARERSQRQRGKGKTRDKGVCGAVERTFKYTQNPYISVRIFHVPPAFSSGPPGRDAPYSFPFPCA
eukprot:scaffold26677_cov59-Phaeocystis_antarctica.AAC.4